MLNRKVSYSINGIIGSGVIIKINMITVIIMKPNKTTIAVYKNQLLNLTTDENKQIQLY